MKRTKSAIAAMALGLLPWAAQAENISIELNKLEANEAGCLGYLVLQNSFADALDSFVVELYTFDPSGVIGENLVIELAPLAGNKMTVKGVQFGDACDSIAQVLVNSVPACTSAGAAVETCAAGLALSSKASAELAQ